MKILVPTDFSACADEAADYAMNLAERLGASVTLLHAYHIPIYPTPEGSVLIPVPKAVDDTARQAAQAVDSARRRLARATVPVEAMSVEGAAAEVITRVAEDERFDLVVMGTHGRTGIKHFLLGSVAERVVRTSSCPVLTVRMHAAAHEIANVPLL